MKTEIKNIVFDVGNVIVTWSPEEIISQTFPKLSLPERSHLVNSVFKSNTWRALNLGYLNEDEAKQQFIRLLDITPTTVNKLFKLICSTQSLIPGTVEILQQLENKKYALYGLTDNVHFIVTYLRKRYDFWKHLLDVTISAEVGMMKPDEAIFNHVIKQNNLLPHETVFIDDHLPNILSAKAVGMHAIQFIDAESCIESLRELGVHIL